LKERIAAYAAHFPTGVSTWVLAHFLQLAKSGRFQKFDYGKENNIIRYGQAFPPDYPLYQINLRRISIFYSINDAISNYRDVQKIQKYLTGMSFIFNSDFLYIAITAMQL